MMNGLQSSCTSKNLPALTFVAFLSLSVLFWYTTDTTEFQSHWPYSRGYINPAINFTSGHLISQTFNYSTDRPFQFLTTVFRKPPKEDVKLVLFYTLFYYYPFTADRDVHKPGHVDLFSDCPINNCRLTTNRSHFNDSSAVVFHVRDLGSEQMPDFPLRKSSQHFIMYLVESPYHTGHSLKNFRSFFNLTFTYRLDSDIISFQQFTPSLLQDNRAFGLLWKNKVKFGAAFISNCAAPSARLVYLNELAEFVEVDIFGSCGSKRCNVVLPGQNCDLVVRSYKFYFAFENSVCKDYVTEKIQRAYMFEAVPVVYGGANYTSLFPLNSFINVMDFPDVSSLARHLKEVAASPESYMKYMMWRYDAKNLKLPPHLDMAGSSWCRLCSIINDPSWRPKVYADVAKWWYEPASCAKPVTGWKTNKTRWLKHPDLMGWEVA